MRASALGGGSWRMSWLMASGASAAAPKRARRVRMASSAGIGVAPNLFFQLFALFAQDRFAAQLDFVAFERQDFDQNLIAFLQLVAHVLNAIFRDLADMQQ